MLPARQLEQPDGLRPPPIPDFPPLVHLDGPLRLAHPLHVVEQVPAGCEVSRLRFRFWNSREVEASMMRLVVTRALRGTQGPLCHLKKLGQGDFSRQFVEHLSAFLWSHALGDARHHSLVLRYGSGSSPDPLFELEWVHSAGAVPPLDWQREWREWGSRFKCPYGAGWWIRSDQVGPTKLHMPSPGRHVTEHTIDIVLDWKSQSEGDSGRAAVWMDGCLCRPANNLIQWLRFCKLEAGAMDDPSILLSGDGSCDDIVISDLRVYSDEKAPCVPRGCPHEAHLVGDVDVLYDCSADGHRGINVALHTQVGDIIYVIEVDAHGWARAMRLSDGQQGWVPLSHCKRHVYSATRPYDNICSGDAITVYDRVSGSDGYSWAYGVVACSATTCSPYSRPGWPWFIAWFPVNVLD
mmetsp:Transcript_35208/g.100568  ORF Transcript_35208/g.100568 Transcript_35208/m.100568 type:complete len:408 (-) Transcript_35208:275-1498(-)